MLNKIRGNPSLSSTKAALDSGEHRCRKSVTARAGQPDRLTDQYGLLTMIIMDQHSRGAVAMFADLMRELPHVP